MHREYLMGNEVMALAALAAGVNVVCGYPGTPSSEVLETVAKRRTKNTYVEWSVNEKAALEMAAGAAYSGARALVTMKQVGLNVASDPLMSLEYVGVEGGMVILVADDPGPISSQTEQDTRTFAAYSKVPCFDPSTAEEAYEMMQEAFKLSEAFHTPVFMRPTTRVCHGYASILVRDEAEYEVHSPCGFKKDSKRWVIFPRLSFANHAAIEQRNTGLSKVFSQSPFNPVEKETREGALRGIAASGIAYAYAKEEAEKLKEIRLFKVGTPFPFPEEAACEFLQGLSEVIVFEELDPVVERNLTYVAGKYHLPVSIKGKLTGHTPLSGECSRDQIRKTLTDLGFCSDEALKHEEEEALPPLPVRPPVLCAGCPHRASFYAVKTAMKNKKAFFGGDIGCYTLGNAQPLDMVDTCLCMGAGVNIAQAINRLEPDTTAFAFVGDSTFFASAITGLVNAVYNQANMTLILLDNATTAMTGHQPHPGTGRTMMGEVVEKIDPEKVLRGIGLEVVETVDPLDLQTAIKVVKEVSALPGVKAIIFRSPCVAIVPRGKPFEVETSSCIHCLRCIKEIGCPALYLDGGQVRIDETQCNGCGLCAKICPKACIRQKGGQS